MFLEGLVLISKEVSVVSVGSIYCWRPWTIDTWCLVDSRGSTILLLDYMELIEGFFSFFDITVAEVPAVFFLELWRSL